MIAIVGLVLFGRRLPEVGRALGKTFVQFKSGLQDMQAEMHDMNRMAEEEADRAHRDEAIRDVEATEKSEGEDRAEPPPQQPE